MQCENYPNEDRVNKQREMSWLTIESEYEGFPLFVRKPNYKDIYKFKDKFPILLRVYHEFERVKNNGLPEPNYNMTLMDFDEEMAKLFDSKMEGIVFLVETFGGKRGYYYFISDVTSYKGKLEKLKHKYSVRLENSATIDRDWDFLKKYPTKLY